jgi:hypothetical protein
LTKKPSQAVQKEGFLSLLVSRLIYPTVPSYVSTVTLALTSFTLPTSILSICR